MGRSGDVLLFGEVGGKGDDVLLAELRGVTNAVIPDESAYPRQIGLRCPQAVVLDGAKVVLVGIAGGVGAAVASTRFLGTLLYDVRAVDPLIFAGTSLMMLSMGMLASYMPARRASSVNPVKSMRSD